jgi:6-phosphogluconolactonase
MRSIAMTFGLLACVGCFVFAPREDTTVQHAFVFTPRFLYVANGGSNDVSSYRIDQGGLAVNGPAVPAGQHPGFLAASPAHKFLYVANLGDRTISGYRIDAQNGHLSALPGFPFSVGEDEIVGMVASGRVDARRGRLYVATRHGRIRQYDLDNRSDGTLTSVFTTQTREPDELGGIVMDAFGRYLIASRPTAGTIGLYRLDPGNGNPSRISSSESSTAGTAPRAMAIGTDGNSVYVSNNGSSTVAGFSIDAANDRLLPGMQNPFLAGQGPSQMGVVRWGDLGDFAYLPNVGDDTIAEYGPTNAEIHFTGHASVQLPSGTGPFAATGISAGSNFGEPVVYIVMRGPNRVERFLIDTGESGLQSAFGELVAGESQSTGTSPEAIIVTGKFERAGTL